MEYLKIKKRIIQKYIEYLYTKGKLAFLQKKYEYNNVVIKYLFKKKESDTLIIIFSSFTRKGIKARYNYVRTLNNCRANQLFILDDFAKDQRGSYYIGYDMTYVEEEATKSLIDMIINLGKIKSIIFCGSSKGGWAALNFGLQFANSSIIAGGPQYFLGDYLLRSGNKDTLYHIIGETTKEKIHCINRHLEKRIVNNQLVTSQNIYLHFSINEHTYEEHIRHLIDKLEQFNYSVFFDAASYTQHSDISYYFPQFLLKSIDSITGANRYDKSKRNCPCI